MTLRSAKAYQAGPSQAQQAESAVMSDTPPVDPFSLTAADLRRLLLPDAPLFPEIEAARAQPTSLHDRPSTRLILAQTEPLMATIAEIPTTRYTSSLSGSRSSARRTARTPP